MGVITNDTRTEGFKRQEAGLPPLPNSYQIKRVEKDGKHYLQQRDGSLTEVTSETNPRKMWVQRRGLLIELQKLGVDISVEAYSALPLGVGLAYIAKQLHSTFSDGGIQLESKLQGKDKKALLDLVKQANKAAQDVQKLPETQRVKVEQQIQKAVKSAPTAQPTATTATKVQPITKNSLKIAPTASPQAQPTSPQTQGIGGQRVTASMADKFAGTNSQIQGPLQQQNTSATGFNDLGREDARLVREQRNPHTRYVDKPLADKGQLRQQVTRLGKPQVAAPTAAAPTPKPTAAPLRASGSFTAPNVPKSTPSPMVSVGGSVKFSPISTLKGGIANAVIGAIAQPYVEQAGEFLGNKLAEGI